MVRQIADRIAIMYLGEVVEIGDKRAVVGAPRHPYTGALLSAVPRPRIGREARSVPQGDIPSPLRPPSGCRFHPRCPYAVERCCAGAPLLRPLGDGRQAACHRHDDIPAWRAPDDAGMPANIQRRLDLIAARRARAAEPTA